MSIEKNKNVQSRSFYRVTYNLDVKIANTVHSPRLLGRSVAHLIRHANMPAPTIQSPCTILTDYPEPTLRVDRPGPDGPTRQYTLPDWEFFCRRDGPCRTHGGSSSHGSYFADDYRLSTLPAHAVPMVLCLNRVREAWSSGDQRFRPYSVAMFGRQLRMLTTEGKDTSIHYHCGLNRVVKR